MRATVFSILVLGLMLLHACKQADAAPLDTQFSYAAAAKGGHAEIALQCGDETFLIDGLCTGGMQSGALIVAVQDAKIPTRVFTICFNTAQYPMDGKPYQLGAMEPYGSGSKPSDVYAVFSEINARNQMDWVSDNASGNLRFETDEETVRCHFEDIRLKPGLSYNRSRLNSDGKLSGTLVFYKKK